MAAALVDTNVLIDVATEDPKWFDWSRGQLRKVAHSGAIAINPVIYAEFSIQYDSIEAVEHALSGFKLNRLALPWEAAFLAGKVYKRYRARGGVKTSPLPDFFIGAHAAISGLALVTRDARRYREYFPKLKLIAPD